MNIPGAVLVAADIAPLREEAAFRTAYESASALRRYKIDRLWKPEDRCLSLGVELMLRAALRRLGLPEEELHFTFGEKGSPVLRGQEGLRFSLCHTGEIVLCAAGWNAIGLDAEKLAEAKLRVAQRFFAPAEAADVLAQPTAEAQRLRFYRCWTLKESYQKMTGLGFHLPMRDFEIAFGEGEITVTRQGVRQDCRFREYDFLPGYACAVCIAGGDFPEPERVDIRELL